MWIKCRGCEARAQEIQHLLAEVERLQGFVEAGQKRLAELADPGISARMNPPPPRAPARPRPVLLPDAANFPGYARAPIPKTEIEVEG